MKQSSVARDRMVKATVAGGLATLLVLAGAAGQQASAAATPQRVLQSVNLDVGTDGTLYKVEDTVVRKQQDGDLSTDKDEVAPKRAADDLPVRVLTSYRTAKKSGTDLSDLKGYDGKVEIDVTVQNTTVRPEKLSYDSAGRTKSAYALVGAPMTVVASANLGKKTVDKVVTTADSGTVTNGALSQDKDGNGTVQWASLLAPPQLAPSSTFTLVMNAEDFSLPSLDISVQPGLAADPSIGGLMRNAFSDNGSSDLAMQQQTISLISRVDGVLADSGKQLIDVRKQLNYSAGTLGDQTIADLQSGTARISSSTRELAGALRRLGGSLGAALKQSRSETLRTLDESVQSVQQTLGDTSIQPPTIPTSGAGCVAQAQDLKPAGSVYGQIAQVSGLLTALGKASGGCAGAIKDSLNKNIGALNSDGTLTCTSANAGSALCAINDATTKVEEIAGEGGVLDSGLASARGELDGLETATAQTKLDGLIARVKSIQQGGGTATLQALVDLIDNLIGADGSTGSDNTAARIQSTYETLSQKAADRLLALSGQGPTGATSSTSADDSLQALQAAIDADPQAANYGELKLRANELGSYIADEKSAWQSVYDATAPDSSAYRDLSNFRTTLKDFRTKLLQQIASGSDADGLYTQPTKTTTDADGNTTTTDFNLPGEPTREECTLYSEDNKDNADPKQGGDPDHVRQTLDSTTAGQVEAAFFDVVCKKADVDAKLVTANDAAKASVTTAAAGVRNTIKTVDASRQKTASELDSLFGQASTGYARSAKQVLANGKVAVGRAGSELTSGRNRSAASLDSLVSDSLKTINTSVASSSRDLESAADLLAKDLRNVLADLGSRDKKGSGLLGVVQAQAAQTKTSTSKIARAGQNANSFSNVRAQEVDGIFLQAAQLRAALERQAELPPFALKLPEGSRHTTVYSFHLREVK